MRRRPNQADVDNLSAVASFSDGYPLNFQKSLKTPRIARGYRLRLLTRLRLASRLSV